MQLRKQPLASNLANQVHDLGATSAKNKRQVLRGHSSRALLCRPPTEDIQSSCLCNAQRRDAVRRTTPACGVGSAAAWSRLLLNPQHRAAHRVLDLAIVFDGDLTVAGMVLGEMDELAQLRLPPGCV